MFGDLDEGGGFEVLLEERSGESVFDDFLGSFDDVGGSVVFLLFGSPVSVVFGLVFVEGDDSVFGFFLEFSLLGEEFNLFVSDGSLFVDFVVQFGGSVVGGGDFVSESGDIVVASSSDTLDVFIISLLFSVDEVVGGLESFDEVVHGVTGGQLELDGVEHGLSEAGTFDGFDFVEDFLVFSGHGESANNQKCNANGGESHFIML